MRQFRVVSGDRDVLLRPGVFIIGRGRTADLTLYSSSVSRKHAMLRISSDRLFVEDIGSRNGVLVNGERIEEPTDLKDGDSLVIGGERIHVVEGAQSSSKFARPTGPPTSEFYPDDDILGPDERTTRVAPMDVDTYAETDDRETIAPPGFVSSAPEQVTSDELPQAADAAGEPAPADEPDQD